MLHPSIKKREYRMLLISLLLLLFLGRKTLAAAHPDTILGKGSGILFGVLFVVQVLMLCGDSMKGYVSPRPNRSVPALPAILVTLVAGCVMVSGGFVAVKGILSLADATGALPAFLGLAVSAVVPGFFGLAGILRESRKRSRRTFCDLFGSSSLVLTGGFFAACMVSPVVLSYTAVLATLFGLAALVVYGCLSALRKPVGRMGSLLLFLCYVGSIILTAICIDK
jgi:hypothetical protein